MQISQNQPGRPGQSSGWGLGGRELQGSQPAHLTKGHGDCGLSQPSRSRRQGDASCPQAPGTARLERGVRAKGATLASVVFAVCTWVPLQSLAPSTFCQVALEAEVEVEQGSRGGRKERNHLIEFESWLPLTYCHLIIGQLPCLGLQSARRHSVSVCKMG